MEYATLVRHYFGSKAYWVTQLFYNLSLIVGGEGGRGGRRTDREGKIVNIASILITAQVIDSFLVFTFKKTFAIELFPSPGLLTWTDQNVLPFDNDGRILRIWGRMPSWMVIGEGSWE